MKLSDKIKITILKNDPNNPKIKCLKIIQDLKEEHGDCSCNQLEFTSGLLTTRNYICIPYCKCPTHGTYRFPKSFIENILKDFDKIEKHDINFYK